jgi:monoamine oxidase
MTIKPRISPVSRGEEDPEAQQQQWTHLRTKAPRGGSPTAQWFSKILLVVGVGLVYVTLRPSPTIRPASSNSSTLTSNSIGFVPQNAAAFTSPVLGHKGKEDSHVFDVIIVGAGWAGLAAAKTLLEYGIENIEILEGRDRVGGRSQTIYPFAADLAVELGSAWIYDDTEPFDLMKDQNVSYGLMDYEKPNFWSWYFENQGKGTKKDQKKYLKLFKAYSDYADEEGDQLKDAGQDKPYQDVLDSYLLNNKLSLKDQQLLKATVHSQVELEYAASSPLISGSFVGGKLLKESAYYYMPAQGGGFDKVLSPIVEPLQQEGKIKLNRKVTHVDYRDSDDDVARATYIDQKGRRRTKLAKVILVTVPLGVLKKQAIDFVPPLPRAKMDAIDIVGFGLLNKAVLYWDRNQSSWWPDGEDILTFVPDDANSIGAFTTFFNEKEVGNGGHFVLSAWAGGDIAGALESRSDQTILSKVMANLWNMFGDQVPRPAKYVLSRWGQDEFAYGSYSYPSVGRESLMDSARRELGARTGNSLFWAGEAIHPTWFGTTVGAYRSGVTAAEDILLTLRHNLKASQANGEAAD